ncbi:MAG TPA: hypothetical protein VFE48_17940 [Methylomirabilota bacterium]|nr:hypothetical protein [Methylomirabilota bacterium]
MTAPTFDPMNLTGRTVEMFSLWADANQRVLRELVDLSASTAKEGVRLYAEIQSAALEAAKEGHAYLLRRQEAMQDASRDPFGTCQKGALDTVEGAQRALRLLESTAQAMTRSAERLETTAEHAGQEIQATVAQLAGKVKSLYAPAA